jgi:hypothetical protein
MNEPRLNEGHRIRNERGWSTCTKHITLPYKLDRSSWPIVPTAPWDGEPDAIVWQRQGVSGGVSMLIARSPVNGSLCGYAGVERSHYMWGQDASGYNLRWEWCPHGGIDFAGEIGADTAAALGLTILKGVWWFGFDCGRSGDCAPKFPMEGSPYRDFDYVIRQVEKLAIAVGTPLEQTTKEARIAWTYAGESWRAAMNSSVHVRWLGTKNEDSPPFTRLDVEHYIGRHTQAHASAPVDGVRCSFTTLVKLVDGRFALVEAASDRLDWSESMGVAKVSYDLEMMRDYLGRSYDPKVANELIHRGRLAMLEPLAAYWKTHYDGNGAPIFGLRRKDIDDADAAFDLAEEP